MDSEDHDPNFQADAKKYDEYGNDGGIQDYMLNPSMNIEDSSTNNKEDTNNYKEPENNKYPQHMEHYPWNIEDYQDNFGYENDQEDLNANMPDEMKYPPPAWENLPENNGREYRRIGGYPVQPPPKYDEESITESGRYQ